MVIVGRDVKMSLSFQVKSPSEVSVAGSSGEGGRSPAVNKGETQRVNLALAFAAHLLRRHPRRTWGALLLNSSTLYALSWRQHHMERRTR